MVLKCDAKRGRGGHNAEIISGFLSCWRCIDLETRTFQITALFLVANHHIRDGRFEHISVLAYPGALRRCVASKRLRNLERDPTGYAWTFEVATTVTDGHFVDSWLDSNCPRLLVDYHPSPWRDTWFKSRHVFEVNHERFLSRTLATVSQKDHDRAGQYEN